MKRNNNPSINPSISLFVLAEFLIDAGHGHNSSALVEICPQLLPYFLPTTFERFAHDLDEFGLRDVRVWAHREQEPEPFCTEVAVFEVYANQMEAA